MEWNQRNRSGKWTLPSVLMLLWASLGTSNGRVTPPFSSSNLTTSSHIPSNNNNLSTKGSPARDPVFTGDSDNAGSEGDKDNGGSDDLTRPGDLEDYDSNITRSDGISREQGGVRLLGKVDSRSGYLGSGRSRTRDDQDGDGDGTRNGDDYDDDKVGLHGGNGGSGGESDHRKGDNGIGNGHETEPKHSNTLRDEGDNGSRSFDGHNNHGRFLGYIDPLATRKDYESRDPKTNRPRATVQRADASQSGVVGLLKVKQTLLSVAAILCWVIFFFVLQAQFLSG